MTRFTIQLGPVIQHYVLCQTSAPATYDGFGTLTVWETVGSRVVLVNEDFFDWQTGRYSSGVFLVKTERVLEDMWKTSEDVANELMTLLISSRQQQPQK